MLLLTVAGAILETVAVRGFVIGGVHLEIVLILVVAWAALRGWEEGLLLGVIGGVLIDVLSAAPFGVSALRLGATGFVTGFVVSRLAHASPLLPIAAATLGSLGGFVLNVLALQASGWTVSWERSLLIQALPSALLAGAAMAMAFPLLRGLERRGAAGDEGLENAV